MPFQHDIVPGKDGMRDKPLTGCVIRVEVAGKCQDLYDPLQTDEYPPAMNLVDRTPASPAGERLAVQLCAVLAEHMHSVTVRHAECF
jgi:hypothetical protein